MSKRHPHRRHLHLLSHQRHRQNPPVVNSRASPSDALASALVILSSPPAGLSLVPDSHVRHFHLLKGTFLNGNLRQLNQQSNLSYLQRDRFIASLHVLNLQV